MSVIEPEQQNVTKIRNSKNNIGPDGDGIPREMLKISEMSIYNKILEFIISN